MALPCRPRTLQIEKEDRVLILGTSSQPYVCDKPKDYNNFTSFFAKMLFLPRPDYHSRQILWVSMLEKYGVSRPNFGGHHPGHDLRR